MVSHVSRDDAITHTVALPPDAAAWVPILAPDGRQAPAPLSYLCCLPACTTQRHCSTRGHDDAFTAASRAARRIACIVQPLVVRMPWRCVQISLPRCRAASSLQRARGALQAKTIAVTASHVAYRHDCCTPAVNADRAARA